MRQSIQDMTCNTIPPAYCSDPNPFWGRSTLRQLSTSCPQIWLDISYFGFQAVGSQPGDWECSSPLGLSTSAATAFPLPQDAQNTRRLSLVLVQPVSGMSCCFSHLRHWLGDSVPPHGKKSLLFWDLSISNTWSLVLAVGVREYAGRAGILGICGVGG